MANRRGLATLWNRYGPETVGKEGQRLMSGPKPHCDSLDVTQEERVAMVALAEVLRDIFLQQRRSLLETKASPQLSDIIDSALTGRGRLLLQ